MSPIPDGKTVDRTPINNNQGSHSDRCATPGNNERGRTGSQPCHYPHLCTPDAPALRRGGSRFALQKQRVHFRDAPALRRGGSRFALQKQRVHFRDAPALRRGGSRFALQKQRVHFRDAPALRRGGSRFALQKQRVHLRDAPALRRGGSRFALQPPWVDHPIVATNVTLHAASAWHLKKKALARRGNQRDTPRGRRVASRKKCE
jgi:hypothetical protein